MKKKTLLQIDGAVNLVLGLWYLAATVQAWRNLGWAREKLGPSV